MKRGGIIYSTTDPGQPFLWKIQETQLLLHLGGGSLVGFEDKERLVIGEQLLSALFSCLKEEITDWHIFLIVSSNIAQNMFFEIEVKVNLSRFITYPGIMA